MDIEKEQLKLRLIEAQLQVLQYQYKEICQRIENDEDQAAATPTSSQDGTT